jgi:hypothetical protein
MDFCLRFSISSKGIFLGCIIVNAVDGIEVIAIPVGPCSLSLHDLIIGSHFGIVILSVLVCHNVILASNILLLILVIFTL